MKMFLIDVKKGTAGSIDVKPMLEEYCKLLNCTIIDIAERCIEGVYYDFICDDEGLFNEAYKVSAVDSNMKQMLVGNLLVCLHDKKGNEVELCDLDIELLKKHIIVAKTESESWYCLKDVEY